MSHIPESAEDLQLFHHGIKGMRWGVTREEGPDGNVSSNPSVRAQKRAARQEVKSQKRETKARVIESRVSKADVRISELQKELKSMPPGFNNMYSRNMKMSELRDLSSHRKSLQKDADAVRNGKMTKNQKLIVAGGIAVASVATMVAVGQMQQSGQLNSLQLRGAAFLKGETFDFAKNPAFAKTNMDSEDVLNNVVKGLNPHYKEMGGAMNCRRVSYAYELRRRGYDVTATPTAVGWGQSESGVINALTPGGKKKYGQESVSSMVVNPNKSIRSLIDGDTRSNPSTFMRTVKTTPETLDDVRKTAKKTGIPFKVLKNLHNDSPDVPIAGRDLRENFKGLPNGARGEILWNFSRFGHSMSWEIFDGEPVIFDAQKAQRYSVDDAGIQKMMDKWGNSSEAEITRLDNVPIDPTFLSRWATNTKR